MTDPVTNLIDTARAAFPPGEANPFLDALERGTVPIARLRELARTLHGLVRSDRRSFALAATRFPDGAAARVFLILAQGEGEALDLLEPFGHALGLSSEQLRQHDPAPLTQAYPAYLSHIAQNGSRSDLALALLANVTESSATYRRIAEALVARCGLSEEAVAHFRYLGATPDEILHQARDVVREGLARGDDPAEARRVARTVHAFEALFWTTMHSS